MVVVDLSLLGACFFPRAVLVICIAYSKEAFSKRYINDGPEHRLAIETLLGRLGYFWSREGNDGPTRTVWVCGCEMNLQNLIWSAGHSGDLLLVCTLWHF